jgi:hypothetical protein
VIQFHIDSANIKDSIYIPKYYSPEISAQLEIFRKTHNCISIADLIKNGDITVSTGDEIGKSAYGTGEIPFVRTSDICNWEIKSAPKQGVSKEIFDIYSSKQDVGDGDILIVRDGTYLIGTNCFITSIDQNILYQSHIIKVRPMKRDFLPPEIFFLILNSTIVQQQISSMQFTADIIDTIGQRFYEIVMPIPKAKETVDSLVKRTRTALEDRVKGKAFIKQSPVIIEEVLEKNSSQPIEDFLALDIEEVSSTLSGRTITSEFGGFTSVWTRSDNINNSVFLPKYYDPSVEMELKALSATCDIMSMGYLKKEGVIDYYTGVEIGKMAYNTGNIPFLRTSDFANWEIDHDPKQGISEEIYEVYADAQDVQSEDIFLVRDGTYLVGSSCFVTELDEKSLFCGGMYKFRVKKQGLLDPYLLLGLLNSFIVKRQFRMRQFTRDVIDTLGNRVDEVFLPIPKSPGVRKAISEAIREVVHSRIQARNDIVRLSREIV